MSIKACDDLRTGSLIRTDDFPVLFGIELGGKFGGVHQITEHHSQLAAFSFGRRRDSNARCDLRGGLSLGSRRLCWLSPLRSDCLGSGSFTSPDEPSPIVITYRVHIEEFFFEDIEVLVIQIEAHLQSAIRHPSL